MNVFEIPAQIPVPGRYCGCGTRLSLWNPDRACYRCQDVDRKRMVKQLQAIPVGQHTGVVRAGTGRMSTRRMKVVRDGNVCFRCKRNPRNPGSRSHCDKCLDYQKARKFEYYQKKRALPRAWHGRKPLPRGIA